MLTKKTASTSQLLATVLLLCGRLLVAQDGEKPCVAIVTLSVEPMLECNG